MFGDPWARVLAGPNQALATELLQIFITITITYNDLLISSSNIDYISHTLNPLVARIPKTRFEGSGTPKTGFGGSKTPKRGVKLKSEKNAFLGKNPHVGLE